MAQNTDNTKVNLIAKKAQRLAMQEKKKIMRLKWEDHFGNKG